MQRMLDLILAAIALLVLSPLLLAIMVVLRFTGEGEIFYTQPRVGKDGRLFGLKKFATMLKDSPNLATGMITVKDDPRILPVGQFLRKTKLNELPQLLNILKGEMSIVGPRPQTQRCFDAFPSQVREEIVKIRPGLSGIGAVVFRDEESLLDRADDDVRFYDEVIAPYKGELEVWLVHHYTLKNYVLVILVTAWTVVFPKSRLVQNVFSDLPSVPVELRALISEAS